MRRRKQPVILDALLDQLLDRADAKSAFDPHGVLDTLKKALAERMLNAEMDQHLGGEAADGRSNSRNGYGQKTVLTESGRLALPAIVQSWRRAWPEVIPFYAFPAEVRRILYTTNAIEALNAKALSGRAGQGTFSHGRGRDQAAVPGVAPRREGMDHGRP